MFHQHLTAHRTIFLVHAALLVCCAVLPEVARSEDSEPAPAKLPNIVYIMSDELAYYELSHMGNSKIHTPNIDQFAAEGIRFTQALAAAPVCAPLRCALMTGKHMGHASVRANDGGTPLRADEPTIASMLKALGYATGGFGKWGAGGRGSTGVPELHGFDVFFGYYDQVHAHSYYPPYLVRNSAEVPLPGNRGGRSGQTYSHYRIMEEGLEFIRDNKDRPFFCYLPITPPHGMYDIPADDPAWDLYRNDAWMQDPAVPQDAKNYAAMVSMVDRNVKEVLDLLRELGLEENTIVFFTGDNGGQDRFKTKEHPRGFFGPNVDPVTGVEFRGGKGSLYEGGLRIPFLVRWPGRIEPGRVSDLLCYQCDVFPTLAELTGGRAPADVDGLSILPELLGPAAVGRQQPQHDHLYWEYRDQRAVRMGNWKGIRTKPSRDWELYDLSVDISEAHDVAEQHPDIVRRIERIAAQEHTPVLAGHYTNRQLHEKDRRAKWGDVLPETQAK
ncbi:MAG: N-acetylgalactosamine 6-sulfate sulfatase (GALNS) [Planctomycetota bacterium]|nr:MAG: N-acetylgalactosamine 6-sulfate sulfatase (GALNS) [Planctomycetota bacterium]